MKFKFYYLFALIFFTNIAFSQSKVEGNNFLIYPSSVTQTEPVVAVSPVDPNILFVSASYN